MALPSTLKARHATERAAREQTAPADPAPGTPPVGEPAVTPVVDPPAQPAGPVSGNGATPAPSAPVESPVDVTAQLAELRASNERLAAELERTRASTVDPNVLATLETNRKFLERRLQEEVTAREALAARLAEEGKQRKLSALPLPEISDAELTEFDPAHVKAIEGLAGRAMKGVVKGLMDEIEALREQVGSVNTVTKDLPGLRQTVQTTMAAVGEQREKQVWKERLKAVVPPDEFDRVVNSQEWREFINTDAGSGRTYNELLANYRRQAQEAPAMVPFSTESIGNIFRVFTKHHPKFATPSSELGNGVKALVSPASVASAPPAHPAPAEKMKASELAQATLALTRKQIKYEDYQKVRDKWEKLRSAGMVEMDVPL